LVPAVFLRLDYPATWTSQGIEERFDFIEKADLPQGARRFPCPPTRSPLSATRWDQAGPESDPELIPAALPSLLTEPALAEVISPHSMGAININTAPLALVEAALRLQGGQSLPNLRGNRQRGVMSPAPPETGREPDRPVLIASTVVWNVLITVGTGPVHRAWWVVVVGSSDSLSILQRHAVDP
jgi:hypothetical protein